MWALDLSAANTVTWTQLIPAGTLPPTRTSHSAIYDAAQNRMIIFGGASKYFMHGDTWALDLSVAGNETWTELTPAGRPPVGRVAHSTVYDTAGNRMLLFAGQDEYGMLDDVWTLDLTLGAEAWAELKPSGAIPVREAHSAVYDASHQRMIVFGGYAFIGNDSFTVK